MFKVDPHVHTAETSKCGHVPAAEFVQLYKALGYDGVVITDHLHDVYLSTLDCRDDWQQVVTRYVAGYNAAKRAGDEIGLSVLFGVELRFPENDSDYLLYGLDEAFLRAHPYLNRTDHATFFREYGDELLIIHAHPYRHCDEVFYDAVHGLEIANGNPRHESRNELALALAEEHPNLYRLCGSDAHQLGDEGRAAVLFEQPVHDSYEFKAAVESGKFRLWGPAFSDILEKSEADMHV